MNYFQRCDNRIQAWYKKMLVESIGHIATVPDGLVLEPQSVPAFWRARRRQTFISDSVKLKQIESHSPLLL